MNQTWIKQVETIQQVECCKNGTRVNKCQQMRGRNRGESGALRQTLSF